MTPRFQLEVSGKRVSGWKSVKWAASVSELCATVTAHVKIRYSDNPEAQGIYEGAPYELSRGNESLCSGLVEHVKKAEQKDGIFFEITARDYGRNVTDCSVNIGKWEFVDETPLALIEKVAAQFALTVKDLTNGALSAKVKKMAYNPGETGQAVIARELKFFGVLARVSGSFLELYTPTTETGLRIDDATQLKKIETAFDVSSIYHRYEVQSSQHYGGHPTKGFAIDTECTDTARVLVLPAERSCTDEEAEQRAKWEASVRRARAFSCNVDLRTPKQTFAWRPGMILGVSRSSVGIRNDSLVVGSSTIVQDDDGEVTSLSLRKPGAFTPEPRPAKVRR